MCLNIKYLSMLGDNVRSEYSLCISIICDNTVATITTTIHALIRSALDLYFRHFFSIHDKPDLTASNKPIMSSDLLYSCSNHPEPIRLLVHTFARLEVNALVLTRGSQTVPIEVSPARCLCHYFVCLIRNGIDNVVCPAIKCVRSRHIIYTNEFGRFTIMLPPVT
jgi:hypothetical protein